MPHAARRPRSWLIFDVGQNFAMPLTIRPYFIACVLSIALATACAWKNDYFDHARKLKEQALGRTPDSLEAFTRLLDESRSADYWTRYYAICFLSDLGREKRRDYEDRITSILVGALDSSDQAVRRVAVSGIRDIGSPRRRWLRLRPAASLVAGFTLFFRVFPEGRRKCGI
jgi:hypothetical protein